MFILPTRARPANLSRLAAAWVASAASDAPVLVRIDADDPHLDLYLAMALPRGWLRRLGPRVGNGPALNEAFRNYPAEDFYGVLADDIVPETPGWDAALIVAAGRDGVAFGDDGIQGGALATHPVLGGDFVRSLGFVALPGLKRVYADTVWTEIARARGVLRYLPEIKIAHRHFSAGAPMDATYRKPEADDDRARYQAWINAGGPAQHEVPAGTMAGGHSPRASEASDHA